MNSTTKIEEKLSYIGFQFAIGFPSSIKSEWVDIEETLIAAIYEIDDDPKMLSMICSWLKIHGKYLITDKFFKEYEVFKNYRGGCPWFNAICAYMLSIGQHKFKKGVVKQESPVYLFSKKVAESGIKLKGAFSFLEEINIFVSKSSIRIRDMDAMKPEMLAGINNQYKNRLLYGANRRADIITAIEFGMKNPYEISKKLNCSYDSAYRVFKEYFWVHGAA